MNAIISFLGFGVAPIEETIFFITLAIVSPIIIGLAFTFNKDRRKP
jgi:hypothetical protein